MDIYKVTLNSEDNNVFEYTTEANCKLDAEFKAFKKISDNNWEHHKYKVKYITVINETKE